MDSGERLVVWVVVLMLLASLVFGALQPYFEARTFNKMTTGPKATYWDAVWADLRVMTQP